MQAVFPLWPFLANPTGGSIAPSVDYPPAKAAQCPMIAVVLLVVLALGFYAFIGTSSKQASEMLLAGMWVVLGLLMLAGIVISLLR